MPPKPIAVSSIAAPKLITHRQLLQELWGPVHIESVHYVRVHMGNLRKKIEADSSRPRWLLTETGVGYRFSPEGASRQGA